MNEIAEDNKRKPKLTVEEQIEHLKSKGVTFELCDEGEASRILSEQDHYFRLAAYRVLFPRAASTTASMPSSTSGNWSTSRG
ncbi:hypothetical protein [Eggerthella lenta]|uniref:hypothetical protein n=1 Tax=Eggerthella lenta TaxID=84112 RepID=UPI001F3E8C2B|nr:hypothetical protein [Eggerthella lenta]